MDTALFLGGQNRTTVETLAVRDPARPQCIVGHAASASVRDVTDAVDAAWAAYPRWSAGPAEDRAASLTGALADLDAERDGLISVLSQETGKIRAEAAADLTVFERRWRLAVDLADKVDTVTVIDPSPDHQLTTDVQFQPLGVVTVIVPFNWPLALLGASLPYALMAGNTVVVKPPPSAPLAAAALIRRIAQRLPAGVLNVVTGDDEVMTPLITDVAKVAFTGSVGGGKKIMSLAATSLTRLVLELGGNDPALVLQDAVLDDAALDRLYSAVFATSGQICMTVKRVIVHRSRMDELVRGLSDRLAQVTLGHGLDATTTMGPLNQVAQQAFVQQLLDEAREAGAEVLQFGTLPGGEFEHGYFVRPAIVVAPAPDLRIVTAEQFGPVIPVLAFDDVDDAVRLANDTWAGLGASVWSANRDAARLVAARLVTGTVWINDHGRTRLDLRAPFGGMRQSGMGREQGIGGVREFQDTRSVTALA